jgi:hypothetical protein
MGYYVPLKPQYATGKNQIEGGGELGSELYGSGWMDIGA